MIPLAEVTQPSIVAVLGALGAFLIVIVAILSPFWITVFMDWHCEAMKRHSRCCPYCDEILRPVTVFPLDGSMPQGARWYCPSCRPVEWFADLEQLDKGPAGFPED